MGLKRLLLPKTWVVEYIVPLHAYTCVRYWQLVKNQESVRRTEAGIKAKIDTIPYNPSESEDTPRPLLLFCLLKDCFLQCSTHPPNFQKAFWQGTSTRWVITTNV